MASPLRPWITTGTGHRRCGTARPPRTPYGASLSFATTTHLWPLPDPPSRKIPAAQPAALGTARSIPGRALASSVSGSPCQGPGTGLPPPISTSVPGTPVAALAYGSLRNDERGMAPSPHRPDNPAIRTPGCRPISRIKGGHGHQRPRFSCGPRPARRRTTRPEFNRTGGRSRAHDQPSTWNDQHQGGG